MYHLLGVCRNELVICLDVWFIQDLATVDTIVLDKLPAVEDRAAVSAEKFTDLCFFAIKYVSKIGLS